jgi:nicotinate-nucleotide pyrophosphorylase (carboxylating)
VTLNISNLNRSEYVELVRRALAEDVGSGDITTEATVPVDAPGRGVLLAKSRLVVAGLDLAAAVFFDVDARCALTRQCDDGVLCEAGSVIADVTGPARALLTAERTALNFLQRLSGIATLTRQFVDAAAGRAIILDTRKTTPTMRAIERYAVRVGGGRNHRSGLFDAFLIKDNHIRLAGGIDRAVSRARAAGPGLRVEVEAQSLEQVGDAVAAGADVVLVDNLALDEVRQAVRCASGRAQVEVSGGVTLDRVGDLAATGADFISVGALTHSAPAADISFEIEVMG